MKAEETRPNDLRIWNLLEYNVGDAKAPDWVLNIVDWQDLKHICEDQEYFNNYFKPIPISEEWLEKLWYEKCNFRENHYVIMGHSIWNCDGVFLCDKNGVVIKHVHQLQNLYFALTQTELTLKEI